MKKFVYKLLLLPILFAVLLIFNQHNEQAESFCIKQDNSSFNIQLDPSPASLSIVRNYMPMPEQLHKDHAKKLPHAGLMPLQSIKYASVRLSSKTGKTSKKCSIALFILFRNLRI